MIWSILFRKTPQGMWLSSTDNRFICVFTSSSSLFFFSFPQLVQSTGGLEPLALKPGCHLRGKWPPCCCWSWNKKSKCSDDLHSSVKLKKIVLAMSLKYAPVTKPTLPGLFHVCIERTLQCLNYNGKQPKKKPNNLQFMITHLWSWIKVKVIKTGINWWNPSKV